MTAVANTTDQSRSSASHDRGSKPDARDAAATALLSAPVGPAAAPVDELFRVLAEAERIWAPVAALFAAADAEAKAAGITVGAASKLHLPAWQAYDAAWAKTAPRIDELCVLAGPFMDRAASTLDDLVLKHRISLTLDQYEGAAVTDLDRLAKSWSPAPRAPAPPFSAAAEVSLAHMVVDYFGSEEIHPFLNCDIALRDRARAILAESAVSVPDPIFAAIEKAHALHAVERAAYAVCGELPDAAPEWKPHAAAYSAWFDHIDNVLMRTVPMTAAGCIALARFAVDFCAQEGIPLSQDREAGDTDNIVPLRLIAQSPAIVAPTTAASAQVGFTAIEGAADAEALAVADAIEKLWPEWAALNERDYGDLSPEAEQRCDAMFERRCVLIDAADALPGGSRAERYAKALALAWLDQVDLWVHGRPLSDYATDGRLALSIEASLTGAPAWTGRREQSQVAADPSPAETLVSATEPKHGYLPAPAGICEGSYGLRVDDEGLGLHAPPGSSVFIEPKLPQGAGLAVVYRPGAGPRIWDLTHAYDPALFTPGEIVSPMLWVCDPITGQIGQIDATQIEKMHKVFGVYVPVEIGEKYGPAPTPLPVMVACPKSMFEQVVSDRSAYPLLRPTETAIVDPNLREPTHGALCVLQWSSGSRSVLLTNRRALADNPEAWWVDPVNRPRSREAWANRMGGVPTLFASDGPYDQDHLAEKIIGTVVGVLGRVQQGAAA